MYKVVILIEPVEDLPAFEIGWPQFLHLVEDMPGLLREASSHNDLHLFGQAFTQMHELFFDSLPAAQQALASSAGQAAGRLLQALTGGRLTLFIASTLEDSLENIRRFESSAQND